ncbi:MAG: IS110 family transposase, partial [Candidatus Zixiibacteriota bacterium]
MTTTIAQSTLSSSNQMVLYLAFELSQNQWKLGFTIGIGQPPRIRTIAARDLDALRWEIQQARQRFQLPERAPVLSCYEAGRDGFWLHRYLYAHGVANVIVDSASIEINRRRRRAKTDRLDVGKLLLMLMRYHFGERKVWRIITVPNEEVEDRRQFHRELADLKVERTSHINRIKGLLSGQGICLSITSDFLDSLDTVRLWNGKPLPPGLHSRLEREFKRILLLNQQIAELEAYRRKIIRTSQLPSIQQVRQLMRLKGIGINSAWLFVMEFFSWRAFHNRREVGALAGLTSTPFQSGGTSHEQGISKAGNRHIRAIAIEIAWGWLRFQPNSKLSRWYQQRFAQGSSRLRRIGIVALARKLLIELWRYLETGIPPEGA